METEEGMAEGGEATETGLGDLLTPQTAALSAEVAVTMLTIALATRAEVEAEARDAGLFLCLCSCLTDASS